MLQKQNLINIHNIVLRSFATSLISTKARMQTRTWMNGLSIICLTGWSNIQYLSEVKVVGECFLTTTGIRKDHVHVNLNVQLSLSVGMVLTMFQHRWANNPVLAGCSFWEGSNREHKWKTFLIIEIMKDIFI